MKKLILALCATTALALVAHAEEGKDKKPEGGEGKPKRPPMTEEQKAKRKALLEKYDTNKDGKLDKEERAKIPENELPKRSGEGKKEGQDK